eukprot:CAMPEP_0197698506 /NCGR_PEP_ID=MMETSP1338-20131121/119426_1 /TAXON_ID=43686 ORGANISM="Pelagodinium beii, Strain RCC1491" /NCGR_SAMPLE_ID=MMETSP1338 /ASSEMBLY_ACC=CAM_ASM_000754 /LENGTH=122 /DNA_ID=CAMNT_0043281909 /DNA_START=108 /DNA_END=473 /DNA_ORIENTATION=-
MLNAWSGHFPFGHTIACDKHFLDGNATVSSSLQRRPLQLVGLWLDPMGLHHDACSALAFQVMFSLNCLGGHGLKLSLAFAISCIALGTAANPCLADTYFNSGIVDTGRRLQELKAEESNFPW